MAGMLFLFPLCRSEVTLSYRAAAQQEFGDFEGFARVAQCDKCLTTQHRLNPN